MIKRIIGSLFLFLALANTAETLTLDSTDHDGLTPLHHAAINNNPSVIEEFVAAGVSLDKADFLGWTALHWAARHGHSDFVAKLIAASANAVEFAVVVYCLNGNITIKK